MKLKIEELAKQADPEHGSGGFASDSIVGKAAIAEFARLIVERCAVECENTPTALTLSGEFFSERCAKGVRKLLEAE